MSKPRLCSACKVSLAGQSEFTFLTQTPNMSGAIGPVCPSCYEFAVTWNSGAVRVKQQNPDGTGATWRLNLPIKSMMEE